MIAVALMVVFTICAVFFLIESGKCSRNGGGDRAVQGMDQPVR